MNYAASISHIAIFIVLAIIKGHASINIYISRLNEVLNMSSALMIIEMLPRVSRRLTDARDLNSDTDLPNIQNTFEEKRAGITFRLFFVFFSFTRSLFYKCLFYKTVLYIREKINKNKNK